MNNIKESISNRLILFRADYKGNITKPEEFWKSGLWSKQINNGNPKAIEQYGWIKAIKSHIRPSDEKEIFIYNTTTYLSFTASHEKAIHYLKGKQNRTFQLSSSLKRANRYIFRIVLDKQDLNRITTGVYLYKFKCNLKKYFHLSEAFEVPEIGAINFISCPYCTNNSDFEHQILIVNCVEFLNRISETENKVKYSLNSAIIDEEWLIMSIDPFIGGGTNSVIPIADFWDYNLYE